MKLRRHRRKGQAIVEYIIIIVIVAVAALTVMGLFSDRIRTITWIKTESTSAANNTFPRSVFLSAEFASAAGFFISFSGTGGTFHEFLLS